MITEKTNDLKKTQAITWEADCIVRVEIWFKPHFRSGIKPSELLFVNIYYHVYSNEVNGFTTI